MVSGYPIQERPGPCHERSLQGNASVAVCMASSEQLPCLVSMEIHVGFTSGSVDQALRRSGSFSCVGSVGAIEPLVSAISTLVASSGSNNNKWGSDKDPTRTCTPNSWCTGTKLTHCFFFLVMDSSYRSYPRMNTLVSDRFLLWTR